MKWSNKLKKNKKEIEKEGGEREVNLLLFKKGEATHLLLILVWQSPIPILILSGHHIIFLLLTWHSIHTPSPPPTISSSFHLLRLHWQIEDRHHRLLLVSQVWEMSPSSSSLQKDGDNIRRRQEKAMMTRFVWSEADTSHQRNFQLSLLGRKTNRKFSPHRHHRGDDCKVTFSPCRTFSHNCKSTHSNRNSLPLLAGSDESIFLYVRFFRSFHPPPCLSIVSSLLLILFFPQIGSYHLSHLILSLTLHQFKFSSLEEEGEEG